MNDFHTALSCIETATEPTLEIDPLIAKAIKWEGEDLPSWSLKRDDILNLIDRDFPNITRTSAVDATTCCVTIYLRMGEAVHVSRNDRDEALAWCAAYLRARLAETEMGAAS